MKYTAASYPATRKPRLLFPAAITLFVLAAFLTACEGPLSIRFPLTGSVVINNMSPRTGDFLSARYVRGNGINAPAWQWYYDDGTEIQGANRQTYQVTQNDYNEGRALYVKVSFEGNTGVLKSDATAKVERLVKVFDNVFALSKWLGEQPGNDPSTPYLIKLNVGSITNSQLPLREIIYNTDKFIELDLSGSSITSIPTYAFQNCPTLTGITIPSSVTTIGNGAFRYGAALTSVTIGQGVTTIEQDAFAACAALKSVTIPSSVTTIGQYAFSSCTSLASVTIGSGVTTIGTNAFNSCTALTSITIPDSVTTIDAYAFYGCDKLASVTIGQSVASIGNSAFASCPNLKNVTIRTDKVTITSNNNWGAIFNAVENVTFEGVTTVDANAFRSSTTLKSVSIPSTVTSIGTFAFAGCTKLADVTIPDSVTSIDASAFFNCTGLAGITIGQGVAIIGTSAFDYCPMTNVIIRTNKVANTTSDNWGTRFYAVENVTFQGVTTIDDYAFYNRITLKSVSIPSTVTSIGTSAFYNCKNLTSVTIPSSVTSIGDGAFEGCSGLTSVTIPSSVTTIGNYAFAFTSLTTVTFAAGSSISILNFGSVAFPEGTGSGDMLRNNYLANGAGTYEFKVNGSSYSWTKQQ